MASEYEFQNWYSLRRSLKSVDNFLNKNGSEVDRYLKMQISDFIKNPPPPVEGEIRLNPAEEYSFQLALMARRFSSWNLRWPSFYSDHISTFLVEIGMYNIPYSWYQLRLGIKKAYEYLQSEGAWRWELLVTSVAKDQKTGPLGKYEVRLSQEMEIQSQVILMAQAMVKNEDHACAHYDEQFAKRRNT